MSTTITKIRQRFLADFLPFGEDMRRHDCDDAAIIRAFEHYCEMKHKRLHEKPDQFAHISECITGLLESKIEGRLFRILDSLGFRLRFQYEIPPYKVDCLIDDFLVFEVSDDANQCIANREHYLRSLGYQVLRVPARLVEICADAVIDEILEIISERKNRKLLRGGRKRWAK